jgi:hypothetical protein
MVMHHEMGKIPHNIEKESDEKWGGGNPFKFG